MLGPRQSFFSRRNWSNANTMNSEYVRELFNYNYWRNQKILSKVAQVQPWQFDAPTTFPFASLRGTLVHVLGAEWLWYQRMHEGVSPSALPSKDEFPTLQSILARWVGVEQQWRAWANLLTDDELKSAHTYSLLDKNRPLVTDPLWAALAHVVNHGTQHCAEMAQMLTDYGQSPGNIDLLYYFREKK